MFGIVSCAMCELPCERFFEHHLALLRVVLFANSLRFDCLTCGVLCLARREGSDGVSLGQILPLLPIFTSSDIILGHALSASSSHRHPVFSIAIARDSIARLAFVALVTLLLR